MSLSIEVGDHRVVTREGVREPHLFKLRSGDLLLTCHARSKRSCGSVLRVASAPRGLSVHMG